MVNAKTAKNAKVAQGMQEDNGNGFQKYLQKTKMCNFHMAGKCRAGANCAFAHEETELHIMPDLEKTQLCTNFQAGSCRKENCKYAHGIQELRNSEFFFKRMPCKFYSQGRCQNGKACRFAHGTHELQAAVTDEAPPGLSKAVAKPATSKATTERAKKGSSQKTQKLKQPDRLLNSLDESPEWLCQPDETDDCWNLLPNLQTDLDQLDIKLDFFGRYHQESDALKDPMKISLSDDIASSLAYEANDLDSSTPKTLGLEGFQPGSSPETALPAVHRAQWQSQRFAAASVLAAASGDYEAWYCLQHSAQLGMEPPPGLPPGLGEELDDKEVLVWEQIFSAFPGA